MSSSKTTTPAPTLTPTTAPTNGTGPPIGVGPVIPPPYCPPFLVRKGVFFGFYGEGWTICYGSPLAKCVYKHGPFCYCEKGDGTIIRTPCYIEYVTQIKSSKQSTPQTSKKAKWLIEIEIYDHFKLFLFKLFLWLLVNVMLVMFLLMTVETTFTTATTEKYHK